MYDSLMLICQATSDNAGRASKPNNVGSASFGSRSSAAAALAAAAAASRTSGPSLSMSANNLSLAGLMSDRSINSARTIDGMDRAFADDLDPAAAPQAPVYPEIDVDVDHLQYVPQKS